MAGTIVPHSANRLLGALSPPDFSAVESKCETVNIELRDILATSGEPPTHVYLPLSGYVSLIVDRADGRSVEVGMYGNEGIGGQALAFGAGPAVNTELVQMSGTARRLAASDFLALFNDVPNFRRLVLLFEHVKMVQLMQTAVSVGYDRIERRLARWLLMCQDRVQASVIEITHSYLSVMLGVRRSGVTDALHELESMLLIKSERGRITIVDRKRLENFAGASYGLPESEYDRLIVPPVEQVTA